MYVFFKPHFNKKWNCRKIGLVYDFGGYGNWWRVIQQRKPEVSSHQNVVCVFFFLVARGGANNADLFVFLLLLPFSPAVYFYPRLRLEQQLPHSRTLPDTDQYLNGLTQRFFRFLVFKKRSYVRFTNYRHTLYHLGYWT